MAEKILILDVEPSKVISTLAMKLKEMPEFEMPGWANFVKTGPSKDRPPVDENWWCVRAASILRSIYVRGVIGVSRLRNKYGSRKNRGMKPEKFKRASGKIIRTILQQATKAGLVEHIKEKKAGRRLTKKGREFLDNTVNQIK